MQDTISRATVAAILSLTIGGAGGCSAFGETRADSSNDGTNPEPGANPGSSGGNAPILGEPTSGGLELAAPTDALTWMHGRTETVKVRVTRKAGFAGEVKVTARNLPDGLTSETLTLGPGQLTGDLKVTVGAASPQGTLPNVVVEASFATGAVMATTPLKAFVRGAPGELDTTFATGGVLDPGGSDADMFVMPDDRLWRADRSPQVARYSRDGVLEQTIPVVSLAGRGSVGAVDVRSEGIYLAGNYYPSSRGDDPTRKVWALRLKFDGTLDPAFSASVKELEQQADASVTAVVFSPTGRVALVGTNNRQGRIWWFGASGAADPGADRPISYATVTSSVTAVVYVSSPEDSVVYVDGSRVLRVSAKTGLVTPGFANGGVLSLLDTVALRDIVVDAKGRFVISGRDNITGVLYLARIAPDGTYDKAWSSILGGSPVMSGSGALKLDADGKVLQAGAIDAGGGASRCVVLRYKDDGRPDPTFGDQGRATLPVTCSTKRILLQSDGRILVGGPTVVRVWN